MQRKWWFYQQYSCHIAPSLFRIPNLRKSLYCQNEHFPSRSVVNVLMSSSLSVRFGVFHFLLTFVCSLCSFPVGSGVDTLFVCPSLGHLFVEPLLWCSFLDIDFLVSRLFFTAVGSTFVFKIPPFPSLGNYICVVPLWVITLHYHYAVEFCVETTFRDKGKVRSTS